LFSVDVDIWDFRSQMIQEALVVAGISFGYYIGGSNV
jgi:hypothetical protein